MPPTSRTITRGEATLTLPEPKAVSFRFLARDHSAVKITVPPTSTWDMRYHWHDRPALCERIDFLPGGDVEFYRSLGVYRSSTETGSTGMPWQNRPGERCTWFLNSHRDHPPGSPDLEVFVRSPGNEEMWRNVVSAILDQDLWPKLSTTPFPLRLLMRAVRTVPLVGARLLRCVVGWVLWVQLLIIFQRYEYWVWCGEIPICRAWVFWPWPGLPPEWAQRAQWKTAYILTRLSVRTARAAGWFLGLKDGYIEYYSGTEDTLRGS